MENDDGSLGEEERAKAMMEREAHTALETKLIIDDETKRVIELAQRAHDDG